MYFSPAGFTLALAFAQRAGVPQNAAPSVGLVGGVAGTTPFGLALAIVLAQRLVPPPPRRQAQIPPQGQAQGQAQAQQMLAAAVPAAAQAAVAQMMAAARQLGPAGMFAADPNPLPPPDDVRVVGHRIDHRLIIRIDWDRVPGARHYYVRRYHRAGLNHPWHGMPEESTFVDGAHFTEVVLPEGTDQQHAEHRLGFSVAAAREPFLVGQDSEPRAPGF
jgi:hypothetical protein